MNDYERAAADRNSQLRNLNASARSTPAFGYRGQASQPGDGHAARALDSLRLKRGAALYVPPDQAAEFGAVDLSGPIRQIINARPGDPCRAVWEMAANLRESYADQLKGRYVSANESIDGDVISAFVEAIVGDV